MIFQILFCPSARAGPPGPPGPPGLPGRDGRDGRDCPPCNCASVPSPPVESPCPGSPPPVPQGPPVGGQVHYYLLPACRILYISEQASFSWYSISPEEIFKARKKMIVVMCVWGKIILGCLLLRQTRTQMWQN